MASNIQLASENAAAVPNASAPGKARVFRDAADGLLKFKDNVGAITPIAGVDDYKAVVRFVTTDPLAAYTRVGNTITADAVGALGAQDGVTPVLGDSFLLTTGVSGADNGIWEVTQLGSGIEPFILERRSDFSSSSLTAGLVIPVGPEGTLYGKTLWTLITTGAITLNTTVLAFEQISGGAPSGSFAAITSDATVPADQSMVYVDDVNVGDGGNLILAGALTSGAHLENFSINYIPPRSTRVIQQNDLMFFTDSLTVDGNLVVDGDLFDATPLNGNDILTALTEVAPDTPSILGTASPTSFLSPAQARTVMDVYSTSEVDTAISGLIPQLPFSGTINSTTFNATTGTIHLIDPTATLTVNLPASPADNDEIHLQFFGNGNSGALTVDAGTNSLLFSGGATSTVISMNSSHQLVFKYNTATTTWALISDVQQTLLNALPYALLKTDDSNVAGAVGIADESVVGRTGGSEIGSIPISTLVPNLDPTPRSVSFTVDVAQIALVDTTATLTATMPATPTDGDRAYFLFASGAGGGTLTLDGNGNDVYVTGTPTLPVPMRANTPYGLTFLFDAGTNVWLLQQGVLEFSLSGTAQAMLASDGTGSIIAPTLPNGDDVFGRVEGSDISALRPWNVHHNLYDSSPIGDNTTATQTSWIPGASLTTWLQGHTVHWTGANRLVVKGIRADQNNADFRQEKTIANITSGAGSNKHIVLVDTDSAAAFNERIICPGASDFYLAPGAAVRLVWSTQGWIVAAPALSADVAVKEDTQTTDATPFDLLNEQLFPNTCASFKGQVQALETATGDAALWDISALIYSDGGGNITIKDVAYLNGPYKDAGTAAWVVSITGAGLSQWRVTVTGEAAHTINWRLNGTVTESQTHET